MVSGGNLGFHRLTCGGKDPSEGNVRSLGPTFWVNILDQISCTASDMLDTRCQLCDLSAMATTELTEALIEWLAAETQTAVFRSLLALEVLALTFKRDVSPEMLDAIRNPLLGLYEMTLEETCLS